ncbi:MAG TPA: xanthine dehydrogenase family protein molybdopterin-binding subunit [Ktedonobacteraceae bacterium]|nr:xanthine dehydrogenase family protein molybdopterin-binding subunit [Ktedonobacteraceae bacterium]
MAQTIDTTGQSSAVGKRTRRKDAADKVRGLTRYAGDMPVAGLLHARLVLSPYAHARIVNINTSAAEAIPGVVAVYTSETLGMAHRNSGSRSQSPLAQKEVFWCGHPVAIVLAETEAAAEDGAAAVDVDYEQLPVVMDPIAAMQPGAPRARLQENDTTSEIAGGGAHASVTEDEVADTDEELSQNVSDKAHYHEGNIEAAWNEAEVVVERTYRTSFVHQSYIEPQSITVVPSTTGQQMTIWASSQGMFSVRSDVSEALNVPERQIRVESVPIGGAFGGKFGLVEPLAAAAAFAAHRPVRLVYTRSEDLLAGNPAPQSIITIKLGAKRDGTLVAMQAKVIFDTGAYAGAGAGLGGYILGSTYRCPNLDIRCYEVLTNKVGVGAYRAPTAPQATYALESAVDELCEQLQVDPVAFRLKNGLKEGDPTLDKSSPHWPRIGLLESIEKVQEHPLWAKRAEQKNPPPDLQGWKVGTGIAVGGWPGGTQPSAAACRLESDGTVTVVVGTVDLTGSDTSLALIAAQGLGMPVDTVNVAHGNTDTMPFTGGTGGSKTTYSVGPAVLAAAQDARNQILTIAADMLEAASTDLEIEGDKVVVRGSPGKSVALKDIASASMQFAGKYEPIYGRGRSAIRHSSPMFGAHVARVAVDPETGHVRVLDYLVAQDVGLAINPAEVEGQIFGGVMQGIGWALLEGMVYDENGQLLTSTLMDYALPHIQDMPHFETIMIEIPSTLGPFGAKGVGEPPVVPVGAAIANAIYDAVGIRMTQLPITPERLYSALH